MDAGGSITQHRLGHHCGGRHRDKLALPVMVEQRPELVIEKTGAWVDGADGHGFADVDELVNYTITVMNTGNVTLHDVTVTDPFGPRSAAPTSSATTTPSSMSSASSGKLHGRVRDHAGRDRRRQAHNEATAAASGPQDQPASDTR